MQGAKEAVMSYIKAMGERDYATARNYLGDNVRVKGPAGEAFRRPDEFLKMMEQQHGKYDIKKVFVDGSDVCLLYDFVTPRVTTFFCSWYQVKDEKINSIQTVFDPRAFAPHNSLEPQRARRLTKEAVADFLRVPSCPLWF